MQVKRRAAKIVAWLCENLLGWASCSRTLLSLNYGPLRRRCLRAFCPADNLRRPRAHAGQDSVDEIYRSGAAKGPVF